MKHNCRNCHYYNKDKGYCNYYKDDVPFILDNSCKVWARKKGGEKQMKKKGVPKRDGSGQGTRANQGRGGCSSTQRKGKGRK